MHGSKDAINLDVLDEMFLLFIKKAAIESTSHDLVGQNAAGIYYIISYFHLLKLPMI